MTPFEMASFKTRATLDKRYSPYPDSLDPLTPVFKDGLIPIALCACMSLVSVTALLLFITHRLISWRKHYKEYVGYNQYIILIYNLLLADLQQSIAFSISFHWLHVNKIVAPSAACFVQGLFLNIGDVASGFFVLAIAIHTWLGVVKGYRMRYSVFVASILFIWLAAILLTIVGPAMYQDRYFARAGGWCWIAVEFQNERLYLHYLWIFIDEFATIFIYAHIFFHLRGRLRTVISQDTSRLSRAAKFMILYPLVYVILTLPIAVGRMVAMSGRKLPDAFLFVAGTLLTSCGWIDALLYTLTRRVLVTNELSNADGGRHAYSNNITATITNAARPGDENFGLQSINKDVSINRTVTIVGGANRLSRLVEAQRGRSHIRDKHSHPDPLRESSLAGSEDSIVKSPGLNEIGIVTETNIQVERRSASDAESDVLLGMPPSLTNSRSGLTSDEGEIHTR